MPRTFSSSRTVPADRLPAHERRLAAEAALLLAGARLAIAIVPFARLSRLFMRPASGPELEGAERAAARAAVRRALHRGARRLPGQTVCFPRAVAAQAMLRRRGVSTVLYCGAARAPETGLAAHVWLADGDEGIVGQRAAAGRAVLARYDPTQER